MLNQTKNILIGFFIVVACGLVISMILFIEPSIGDNKQTLYLRFSNVNGISLGTRVTLAGKPIGEVVAISTIPNPRNQPTDELGQIYYYQLTIHIDSHVKIYTCDEISIQTTGLLGERSIVFIPKLPPKGIQPKLATVHTPLYANSIDPIESAFHQLSGLAEKVEDAVDAIVAWVDQNGPALGSAVRSFDRAMKEVGDTMASVNQKHLIDDVQQAVHSFTQTSDSIHTVIDNLDENGFFNNLNITVDRIKNASGSLEDILFKIDNGQGSLGKFVTKDDLYLELMSIFAKVDTTMNDVNHYGILFNLNKEWQRSRQKRANLLNALKTPQEFKNYFQNEVDLISTSMGRLSVLIEKAEQTPEKQQVLRSPAFRKDFAELLRRVNILLDQITLYNEQLEEASGACLP
ncbi:MAG: MCE family protein [Chlamydiae bacterium]|nr:MCE family protein [Chlamydiota bacterium]